MRSKLPTAAQPSRLGQRGRKTVVVGLSALVLALIGAAIAMASDWVIEGQSVAELGGKEETAGTGSTFVLNAPAAGYSIECKKETSTGSVLTGSTGLATFTLGSCVVPGVPACIVQPIVIKTKFAISGSYLVYSPASGSNLALVEIEECGIPEITLLTGSLAAEDAKLGTPSKEHAFTFSKKISEAAKVVAKLGTAVAYLEGTDTQALAGGHKGQQWWLGTPYTRLCKVNSEACEAYAAGTTVSAGLEAEVKFNFLYEGEQLEPPCRVSSMSGTTTKAAGEPLLGTISSLTFKECGGGLCTVTAQRLPYQSSFAATGSGNGTMTWSSGGSGAPAFGIKCLGATKCIYGATSIAFTVTGGNPAKLSNSGVALKLEEGSGAACGSTNPRWEGVAAVGGTVKYQFTAPSPLFLRAL